MKFSLLVSALTIGFCSVGIAAPSHSQDQGRIVPRSLGRPIPLSRRRSIFNPQLKKVPPVLGISDIEQMKLPKSSVMKYRKALAKNRYPRPRIPGGGRAKFGPAALAAGTERVLVVYDDWSQWRFIGGLYGEQLADLTSHYGYAIDMIPAQDYQAGMIADHRATLYIGTLYDTDLPTAFREDAMAAEKPVCWIGYNLWKVAWNEDYSDNVAFAEQRGFRFSQLDMGYNTVTYKDETLGKLDTSLALLEVTDSEKATVIATATNEEGTEMPYIVRSGNFWYVGDNPLSTVAYANQPGHDRMLVFCDVLHDILDDGVVEDEHNALVRIEDVSAAANPDALRQIADILSAEGVPFVVSTIPIYEDPLGYWTQGEPYEVYLTDAPEVVSALKYMESKGGQILQHGTTHQYQDIANPYFGISGSDWEFFRVVQNTAGNLEPWGPVWEDSATWVADRVQFGKDVLFNAGFDVKGWVTPHYLASPIDYQEFSRAFDYSLCPTVNFTIDDEGYLFYLTLNTPFPTKDHLGTVHLPESMGYISPGTPNMDPSNIVTRAHKLRVLRDSWAGFFFHPYLDPELLRTAVQGVKAEGYTFVNPTDAYAPIQK